MKKKKKLHADTSEHCFLEVFAEITAELHYLPSVGCSGVLLSAAAAAWHRKSQRDKRRSGHSDLWFGLPRLRSPSRKKSHKNERMNLFFYGGEVVEEEEETEEDER